MKQKIYFEAKAKKSKSPIEKVVKDLGINYPNESLGFLHAIYAKVDGETPNKNKVILAKTVKNDVPQLRFTQANINHKRQGYVIGTILDAWVNADEQIEIVFSFFKSLYPKEWEIVENAIEEDEMSVSFELMVENDDVVQMANGVRKLKRVTFDGVGLLFPGVAPAYPSAKVLQSANAIVDSVFNNKNLICASAQEAVDKIEKYLLKFQKEVASYKCECLNCGKVVSSEKHCKDIKCSECGGEMRRHDRPSKQNTNFNKYKSLLNTEKGDMKMDKKTQEALLAEFKKDVISDLGEEAVKDWSEEQWEAELQKRAEAEEKTEPETSEASENEAEESKEEEAKEETEEKEEASDEEKAEETKEDVTSEEKVEESKDEEKAEETKEDETSEETAEKYKVEEEVKTKQTREYDNETMEEKIVTESESTVKVDDEIKQVRKQLEEVLYKAEELEKELAKKNEEISFLKENAKKVIEIRAELGDFVKDFSDSDLMDENKLENARLKKRVHELENKDVETAEDKSKEDVKDEDLKTGHDEKDQKDEETADKRVSDYLKSKYGKK